VPGDQSQEEALVGQCRASSTDAIKRIDATKKMFSASPESLG
jgi:hypothetical protein